MATRFSKPLMLMAVALAIAIVVGTASTTAFAIGANPNNKIAVHIKAHPTSCTKGYPVLTDCSQIVSTWASTGDLDAMPVFYDLTQYTVVETGLTWPEASWGSASWVKCKGDIAIGVVQHTAVPEDTSQTRLQTNGTAVAWSTCQTGAIVLPGFAWIAAGGPGYITPSPNPVSGDYGVVDCAPDPGPWYQLPDAIYAAGIAGNTGDNACTAPSCNLSQSSLSFGTVTVGGSLDLTFRVTNNGGGSLVSRPSISGADSTQFSIIVGAGTHVLASGQFFDITVRFSPTSVGSKTAQVNVSTGGCGPVPLTGEGFIAPTCLVTPTSLDFGTVNVGSQSDLTFTIKNTGGGTLSGTVSESCPDYQLISGGGAYSLTANQTVTVTVRFAPASAGEKLCTIETGATECVDVLCTGVGQQTIVPLTISKDDGVAATSCVFPGASQTYVLSYSNPNISAVTAVVVTDNLPSDVNFVSASNGGSYDPGLNKVTWTIGGLGAGANGSVNVVTTVKVTATPGGTLVNNCAIVSAETPTPVTASHNTAICTCAISGPELVCPNSSHDYTAPPGMVSYLWTISGNGAIVGSNIGQTVSVLAGATCGQSFTLTLNLAEPGGIESSCQKVVNVNDTVAPVITCPANTTIQCGTASDPAHTGTATATDNCDATPTITSSDQTTPGACPQASTISRTWRATDDCGNSATCVQTITIVDTTAPVITCPANTTIQCGTASDPAHTGTATATDNCDATPTITSSDQTTPGACPQASTIARTWRATDHCGNSATCVQTITIVDTTAPVITCPANTTIQCGAPSDPAHTGTATATDNCDATPTITSSDQTTPGACPQASTIARTWRATDHCGNSATCVQTITVVDTTVPVITCAANQQVPCGSAIVFTDPTAVDICDPTPTIAVVGTTTLPGGPGEIVHTRTWSATDHCGNSSTCSQSITETGCSGCAITGPGQVCPGSTTEFCGPGGMTYQWSIVGNGTLVPPTTNQCVSVIAAAGCNTQFILTLSLNGGVAGTCSDTVTVIDQTAPVITCPINTTIECSASSDPANTGSATATDNCGGTPVISHSDVTTPGTCPQNYTIARTWRATDACGNSATCIQTITVHDTTAPVISSCPPAVTVQCIADVPAPNPSLVVATDNCSAVTVTFVSDSPEGACPTLITRTYRASDACGNSSLCTQLITVDDTIAPTLVCAADGQVACGSPIVFTPPTATDICDPSPVIRITQDYTQPGQNPGEIDHVRCWVATDVCGNTSTECCQTITETGCTGCLIAGPDMVCPGGFATYSVALAPAPGMLWTISGDGAIVGPADQPSVEIQASLICGGFFTLTFESTDPAASCSTVVDVNDLTPPTANPLPPIDVQCADDVPGPNPAIVVASDNCGLPVTVTFVNDVSNGRTCPETIARTYLVTDFCGNPTPVTQAIVIMDTTPPSIVCPADISFPCDAIGDAGTATAMDNCDPTPVVGHSDQTVPGTGPGCYQIRRTWTATDQCLNSAACVQVITVFDNVPPTIVCAANARIACTDPLVFTPPTATDNCDPSPAITVVSTDTTTVPGSGEIEYTRCWQAADGCGNSAQCCQTITREACPQALVLTKNDGLTGPVAPGDTITYTIEVFNPNTFGVTDVVIVDVLPTSLIFIDATTPYVFSASDNSVTWTLASIPGMGTATLTLVAQVDPHAVSGTITNAVSVTSDQTPGTVRTTEQTQVVGGEVRVYVDIKPGTCPNSFNTKSNGVTSVAVLGTAMLDVRDIDPSTIRLGRAGVSGTVAPIRWSYEDVATPFTGDLCGCHVAGADGYKDLVLKFSDRDLTSTLGLNTVAGQTVQLTLTGTLKNGTVITGADCIRILGKSDGSGYRSLGNAGFESGDQIGVTGSGEIAFSFFTAGADHVRIDVYDIHGRLVRTLVDEAMDAGSHSVNWNLTSASGQKVPTGIYFVRLSTQTEAQTKKVIVVE